MNTHPQYTAMTGGEAMIRASIAHGVDTIFGLPGAQIYPLFDAMQRLNVRTITARHEQGAAYMAMGYAKALGQPGVFAVVPGPGVLNATAALCTAMGTCTPVLCLTGEVPEAYRGRGRGHLHELPDQTATLNSLIKHAVHIDEPSSTFNIMHSAFEHMQSARPGPVAVDMCWDTMATTFDVRENPPQSRPRAPELDQDHLKAAVKALAAAKKPMIMCGAGAQHAHAQVLALAELLEAPVTAFRSGRGVVSEDHPLGVSGVAARALFDDVDVLVGVGSRLEMIYMRWRDMNRYEQRPAGGPTLIRIDIDAREFSRLVPDIALHADSATACSALTNALEQQLTRPDGARTAAIAEAKVQARRAIEKIQPQLGYLDVIRRVLPRDGFFVPELSQVGFTSYFGFEVYEPRTYVSEGHQGTLGYGFQTALGVKTACPDRAVVSVNGDGGMMFGIAELATAVAHNIGLVSIVFNNNAYGNVRRDQLQGFAGRTIGSSLTNPDFVKLAESFGAAGYRVGSPAALQPVLEQALAADAPSLIEVTVPPDSETSPWEFIAMPRQPF